MDSWKENKDNRYIKSKYKGHNYNNNYNNHSNNFPYYHNKSFCSLLNLNLIERQEAFLAKRKNDIKLKEKEKQN